MERIAPAITTRAPALALAAFALLLDACVGEIGPPADDDSARGGLSTDQAVCFVKVWGKRLVHVEKHYLANVVFCENTHGFYESLKAQAIAARTFLYWKVRKWGYIGDGQGSQAYSCNNRGHTETEKLAMLATAQKAVDETERQVLLHDGELTCGFFAAGILKPGTCDPKYTSSITVNAGKTGTAVRTSGLGDYRSKDCVNRGGMSQNGANCLIQKSGYDHTAILEHYYGADIEVVTVGSPCPERPPLPTPSGTPPGFEALSCAYGNFGKGGELCWDDVPDRTHRCAWDPAWQRYVVQRCDSSKQQWLTVSLKAPRDCKACCGPKSAACDPAPVGAKDQGSSTPPKDAALPASPKDGGGA